MLAFNCARTGTILRYRAPHLIRASCRAVSTSARPKQHTFLRSTMTTLGVAGMVTLAASSVVMAKSKVPDYTKIRERIAALIEEDPNRAALFVRLSWHASGTYSKVDGTGGSDGATMRFKPECDHGANAGLNIGRYLLDIVHRDYPEISVADLWSLAGAVAIEEAGGPTISWRPGRSDAATSKSCTPDGRLPDAKQGQSHLRDIFYRMGLNDREIVALSGAHTLGRCNANRSGFDGPWTRAPTTFSNLFFQELINNTWSKRKWDGPVQYADPTGDLMMLPSDMALIEDPEFRKWVEAYAKDEELFFEHFAAAFKKLQELGVNFGNEQHGQGGLFSKLFG